MQNDTEHKGKSVPGTNRNTFDANHFDSLGGKRKRLSSSEYRRVRIFFQCKGCGSDYLKFACDGYCQDCQQLCEFITRERPHILQRGSV